MTTIVKSYQTEKCLYCGHTHILRWRTTPQGLESFLASKRLYEDKIREIRNMGLLCQNQYLRKLMEGKQ